MSYQTPSVRGSGTVAGVCGPRTTCPARVRLADSPILWQFAMMARAKSPSRQPEDANRVALLKTLGAQVAVARGVARKPLRRPHMLIGPCAAVPGSAALCKALQKTYRGMVPFVSVEHRPYAPPTRPENRPHPALPNKLLWIILLK